jgi:glutathione S-transferase
MTDSPSFRKVILFGDRLSPFVEKVARVLLFKRVAFELVIPTSPMDFGKWNPQTGKMPVLDVDGRRTFDSTTIAREVDRLVPDPPLFSADRDAALRQRFLEDWSDESLYFYGMAMRWAEENEDATTEQLLGALGIPGLLHFAVGPIVKYQIKGQARAQGLARLPLATVLEEFAMRLEELVLQLGDRPFFFADAPSIADFAVYGMFNTLASGPTPQGQALIEAQPALVAWQQRVREATPEP